jgi:prophage regulatory protein
MAAPKSRGRDQQVVEVQAMNPMGCIYRIQDVLSLTKLARSTIYQMMSDGTFPASVRLGARSVGWHQRSVEDWIESRTSAAA